MKTLLFSMMLLIFGSPMIAQMDTVVQQKMKPQTGENVVVDEQVRSKCFFSCNAKYHS